MTDKLTKNSNTYNIASGQTHSILELANIVKRIYDNRFDHRLIRLCGSSRIPKPIVCVLFSNDSEVPESIDFRNPRFA